MSIANLVRALLGLVMVCNLALTQDSEGDDPEEADTSPSEEEPFEPGDVIEEEKCEIIRFKTDTYLEFHNGIRRSERSSDMIELVS